MMIPHLRSRVCVQCGAGNEPLLALIYLLKQASLKLVSLLIINKCLLIAATCSRWLFVRAGGSV